ncbi:16S rRNA (uracil(1498)-N(3))-methyltransferase [Okibacterium endophyticum]
MSTLFLKEDLRDVLPGHTVELSGPEGRHAVSANRLRVGERLLIGNGSGLLAGGTVHTIAAGVLTMRVDEVHHHDEPMPRIVLAQALAKGDRDELAVQNCTELGVSGIIPWSASRSVSRWQGQKAEKGADRWRAIAREASKQSVRPWVPEVRSLHTAHDLAQLAASTTMIVLEPTADRRLSALAPPADRDIVIVVGPEGGLSPDEIRAFTEAGAVSARLGDEVLRTSSAGPAGLAVLNVALGRW